MHEGSLIIVHLVEPQQTGYRFKRTRMTWPLHITLVPWFRAPSEAEIVKDLERLAAEQPAFSTAVGNETALGAHKDVPVNLIANPEPLRKLQTSLVGLVKGHNATFIREPFIGWHFRPHITHHGKNRRFEGDHLEVREFTLVRLFPQNVCEVVQSFVLKGKA